MRNVESGDAVDIDVSPASVEDEAVAFDGISATVNRDGDFTMRVKNARERLPGSPAFKPDEAATSLGHIRLDHSITNDEVEDVSYTFRVKKSYLRATGSHQEQVGLYRYADGEWTELPTDVVGETPTHYILSSDSPGMSEFVIGAKRPDFDVYWADVDDTSVDAGTTVTVSGRVTNNGGADGVYEAKLMVDERIVDQQSVTIAAGGTRQVNFEVTLDGPGSRELSFSGMSAGKVTVLAPEDDSDAAGVRLRLASQIDRLMEVGHAFGIVTLP